MKIIEGENYPTSEQLQRVRDAARELEEAMRACPEVSFEGRSLNSAIWPSTTPDALKEVGNE